MGDDEWPLLFNSPVQMVRCAYHPSADGESSASAEILLASSAQFFLYYWRLIEDGRVTVTGFDHDSRLGGPPIDAVALLTSAIEGRICERAELDRVTGDVSLVFGKVVRLQGLRIRSLFEDWEVRTAGEDIYWSNMLGL